MPYVVIGVRKDGTRRVLVDGLEWEHAERTAEMIIETRIFREVLVQPRVTVEMFPEFADR